MEEVLPRVDEDRGRDAVWPPGVYVSGDLRAWPGRGDRTAVRLFERPAGNSRARRLPAELVTELYADDGQSIGTFALQRRILLTYNQIPKVLKNAILTTEDQHFEEHWGLDFPRVLRGRLARHSPPPDREGASTLTMQLAGGLFLNRSDRSFHRKIQETILALEIERHYTKDQIFTMYCNQIYLGSGNYGFEAASEYYFGNPVEQFTLAEAATLAAIIRGPIYSPILHPDRALARRNLVLSLMAHDRKITQRKPPPR